MSRVYDALQRSQGENPSNSPLATPQSEAPPIESAVPPAANPAASILQAEPVESSVAAGSRPETYQAEPVFPQVRPSSTYRTEAMQTGAALNPAATSSWLNTPNERVLRPHPIPEQRLVALAEPGSSGAEMFRVLSTRLAHMQNKRALRKLLVTSSTGEEGKSVVAANLALTLAQRAGERTLLIEADLRRPNVSALFTSSKLKGITDWVEGKLALDDALYQVSGMPLWILPAGRPIEEPLPLLESDRFAEMLQTLATAFDWVVIDATPMLPMADATSLSRLSDGVLVVVREGHTRRKILNKALETIEKHKLLGLVLNEASMLQVGYDRYYEGYGKDGRSNKQELDGVKAATA
jgi:capsular exopolysaccharide synthesis family protein